MGAWPILLLALGGCEGAARCRGLRCRAPLARAAARAAEPAATLPPLPPLTIRDAQPSEVDAVAELLSAVFYPERAELGADGAPGTGVGGPPFDEARGAFKMFNPLRYIRQRLDRAAAELGTFTLKASIAQRLSAEAFAQGFDGRPPAGTLGAPDGGAEGAPGGAAPARGAAADGSKPLAQPGAVKAAYALLVAEVELPARDGSGAACRELAAAVEIGVEEVGPADSSFPPSDLIGPDPPDLSDSPACAAAQGSGPPASLPRMAPYLACLAVAPAHRRRGAARQLLRRAEALALGWGYSEIVLDTASANTAAVELYASCGYVLEGQTPLLQLPVSMLLRGDRASGRWRKQLRPGGGGAGEAEAEARERRAVVAAALRAPGAEAAARGEGGGGTAGGDRGGAAGAADTRADAQGGDEIDSLTRLSVWAEALGAHAWRMRWAAAQLLLPFALSAALSAAPQSGEAAQAHVQAQGAPGPAVSTVASVRTGEARAQPVAGCRWPKGLSREAACGPQGTEAQPRPRT